MNRRALGAVLLALALVTAGCAGLSQSGDGTLTPDRDTATESPTMTATEPRDFPDPPATLSDSAVERAAIAAEQARLHNLLRNDSLHDRPLNDRDLTYFELGYIAPPSATVVNRSDGRAYVAVEVHYSYGTGDRTADGVPSRALYVVSESEIRRIRALDAYPPSENTTAA